MYHAMGRRIQGGEGPLSTITATQITAEETRSEVLWFSVESVNVMTQSLVYQGDVCGSVS